jgi:4-amino-4-deoxy-L-arabinose transferase-like glycosyltransferase
VSSRAAQTARDPLLEPRARSVGGGSCAVYAAQDDTRADTAANVFCYRRRRLQSLLKIWLAVVVVAIAIHLGGPPLLDADEGRNAEVAREMAETNDYVMPRLNGLPYLDKPVVYFAAEAAFMEVLGPTELAARLPAYLFTLATAAVLFWFARRAGYDPWVSAIVFLTMPLVVAFARTVIFDSALMFFVVVALAAFWCAVEERNARWSLLAWASMALAMITKGPVTFVLVLFVVLPYAWRRKALGVLFPLIGLVLFAAVIAPWVWGVTRVVPEFLRYVLVTETAARMATSELQRTGPPWYFLPYLIGGALPWSIVALFSWRQQKKADLFLLLWLFVPLVFFSISQSKRPQYILPLMPAVALLVARVWSEARTRAAAITLAILGAILLAAPLLLPRVKMKPEIAAVAPRTALILGLAFAVGGAVALFARRKDLVLAALSLPILALPFASDPLLHAIAERRSTKSMVAEMQPHLTPRTEIIGVEAYAGSLAFYLRRPIVVVSADASELTSNYLIRRYGQFSSNPAAPLKPLPYFERSLTSDAPRVYVLRVGDKTRRALLESRGWRVIGDGARHVAYGR